MFGWPAEIVSTFGPTNKVDPGTLDNPTPTPTGDNKLGVLL